MWRAYRGAMEQTLEPSTGNVLRKAELMLDLWRMGVDLSRLGFLRWLVENGRDPEWQVGLTRGASWKSNQASG